MVAHFWNEESFLNLFCRDGLGKPVDPAIGGYYIDGTIFANGILFNPTPEEEGFRRYIVFNFAGFGAGSASDTFFNIDGNAVPGTFGIAFF